MYSTQTVITVLERPLIDAGIDTSICEGQQVQLMASGGVSYSWQGGYANGDFIQPGVGMFYYVVLGTDANGCQALDTVNVTVHPYPQVSFEADPLSGNPPLLVNFENTSDPSLTGLTWNFGNGNSTEFNNQFISQTYPFPGEYTVLVIGESNGCITTASKVIIVLPYDPPVVVAPNVFTPNGDGVNDSYFFATSNVAKLEFVIVNRWGNVLFESSNLTDGWNGLVNGKDAAEGVYFYRYTATGLNGDVINGHGHLTLIR